MTCESSDPSAEIVLHELIRRAKRNQKGPLPDFVRPSEWRQVLDLRPEQTSREVELERLEAEGRGDL